VGCLGSQLLLPLPPPLLPPAGTHSLTLVPYHHTPHTTHLTPHTTQVNLATIVVGPARSGKSELGLSMLRKKQREGSVIYVPMADSCTCDSLSRRVEGTNANGVTLFENTNGVLQCTSNTEHVCCIFVDDLHCSPFQSDPDVRAAAWWRLVTCMCCLCLCLCFSWLLLLLRHGAKLACADPSTPISPQRSL
jgi:hypothetical protein